MMTTPIFKKTSGLGMPVLTCALAVAVSVPVWAEDAVNTDVGTLDKAGVEKFSATKPPLTLCWPQLSRRGRSSATRMSIRRSQWTPAPSARRLGPRDAYRFAKGEEVMASSGQLAKLSRPLDFLVVTDHSDNMGFFPDLQKASLSFSPILSAANGTT